MDGTEDFPAPAQSRTCTSLRLNLQAAMEGKTWVLLPEGFRDQDSGENYPLPSTRGELMKLVVIPYRPTKLDSGCRYLRRAQAEFKRKQGSRTSAALDLKRSESILQDARKNMKREVEKVRRDMRVATDAVRAEADRAIANLNDLFALGREGIDAQMQAYLKGAEYQGERINARAFRECFRMVTQAVKGLGLPSDQRAPATDAVMDQFAESLKSTQSALEMDMSGDDKETVN